MTLTRFFTATAIGAFTRARDTQINTNLDAVDDGFQLVAAEIDDIVASLGSGVGSGSSATSSSTLSISAAADGSVSKSLTIETGKYYSTGQWITLTKTGDATQQMLCRITSYVSLTGALVCTSYRAEGSGTHSSWVIALGPAYDDTVLHVSGGAMTGAITGMASDSTVKDAGGTERSIGFRDIPMNAQTSAYQLAIGDRGKCIPITIGGVTVPPNATVAFPISTAITIINDSATAQTITQGVGVTLRQAGSTSTGNRTLNGRGMATLVKTATDTWYISGAGLF